MSIVFSPGFDRQARQFLRCRSANRSITNARVLHLILGALCLNCISVAAFAQVKPTPPPAPASLASDLTSPDPMLRDGLYVLQKGDEITIKVFRLPELEETLRVRPDGKISLQLLDDIQAAGLTTKELRAKLATGYSEFFQDPKVSVILRNGADLKVYLGGEVGQPGVVPLLGDLTALSAVLQVGGFKTTAKTDSVILIRNNGHNAPVVQKLNLKGALNTGKGDIDLRPFDVVYVPASRIAHVDRFMDQYGRQVVPANLNGGFTYLLGQPASVVLP